MEELHQMFLDLATLVHEQGEVLDNIARNMESANHYMEKGEKHLQDAKKWYQKARMVIISYLFILYMASQSYK